MAGKEKFSRKYSSTTKEVGAYMGLGTQLAATIILMFFLGRWLDQEFDAKPLWTILLSFFGGVAGIFNFIKTILTDPKLNKKKNYKKVISNNNGNSKNKED
ncbi:MAG: AtpZ/AtpI family protein [Chlorobi bacterium]|nr:AtpZ/AtpI family protein [Chlorobiota bacterium]